MHKTNDSYHVIVKERECKNLIFAPKDDEKYKFSVEQVMQCK